MEEFPSPFGDYGFNDESFPVVVDLAARVFVPSRGLWF